MSENCETNPLYSGTCSRGTKCCIVEHKTPEGWIGVDLDGTLARYDGWKGMEHIGEPIQPMLTRVKRWLNEGWDVRIFTARIDGGDVAIDMGDENGEHFKDVEQVKYYIRKWCIKHIGQELPITNVKDYGMKELWDDRAVSVGLNTGLPNYKLKHL